MPLANCRATCQCAIRNGGARWQEHGTRRADGTVVVHPTSTATDALRDVNPTRNPWVDPNSPVKLVGRAVIL